MCHTGVLSREASIPGAKHGFQTPGLQVNAGILPIRAGSGLRAGDKHATRPWPVSPRTLPLRTAFRGRSERRSRKVLRLLQEIASACEIQIGCHLELVIQVATLDFQLTCLPSWE